MPRQAIPTPPSQVRRRKTDFAPYSWTPLHQPLKVAYPAPRKKTADEMYHRNLLVERISSGPVDDPNSNPEVKKRILSVGFRSPFSGLELPETEEDS